MLAALAYFLLAVVIVIGIAFGVAIAPGVVNWTQCNILQQREHCDGPPEGFVIPDLTPDEPETVVVVGGSGPSREGIEGPRDGKKILESYIVRPGDPPFEGTVNDIPGNYWVVVIGTEVRMDGIDGDNGVLIARPSGTYEGVRVYDGTMAVVREDYAPQYLCEQRSEWGEQPIEDFPSEWANNC